ncbi:N-acetyltransferase [Pseudorhodobacter sp. E13]|uniref:GNAT family N-acetyltransferase n=1 Tax=Pseudorhodobacter sp. E13 TaxID=2487931 RepID=UPI000F8F6BA4|nr:GNAT family N-acetyltransferase [Pseudorhodobacter sp. E13]RUS59857.1 N-acetyltransferase [Pseudorhodobacter sp. E13]
MTPPLRFRALVQARDLPAVLDLMMRASDYVLLEDGQPPTTAAATSFFTDCVPGGDPAQSVKLGVMQDQRLVGIADMGFGYPKAMDAYIGLLLLDPSVRGQGIGQQTVAQLMAMARTRGATRMLITVLEANPRGHAFWQQMGFADEQRFPPAEGDPMRHNRQRMTRPLLPG